LPWSVGRACSGRKEGKEKEWEKMNQAMSGRKDVCAWGEKEYLTNECRERIGNLQNGNKNEINRTEDQSNLEKGPVGGGGTPVRIHPRRVNESRHRGDP